jgi:hypothetical protein
MQFSFLTIFATVCLSMTVSAAPASTSGSLTAPGFTSSAEFEKIGKIFNNLSTAQRADGVRRVGAIVQFNVVNEAGQTRSWLMDLKNGLGSITMPAEMSESSDIDFKVNDVDMARMAGGNDLETLYKDKQVCYTKMMIRKT